MLPLELLGAPEGSCPVRACLDLESLTVHLATAAPAAVCPLCGSDTRRVHSRYTRRLDDLPCLGRCVRLQLAVRRFVCPQPDCPRRIFAERLPGFAAPWARATDRLRQTQTDIGSSLGGEAGARLAARLAITTSPDTLLRRVKRLRAEPAGPPRVVGIDDWAWRKGQRDAKYRCRIPANYRFSRTFDDGGPSPIPDNQESSGKRAPLRRPAASDHRKCGRTAIWHQIINGKWHRPRAHDSPRPPNPIRTSRLYQMGGPSECMQRAE